MSHRFTPISHRFHNDLHIDFTFISHLYRAERGDFFQFEFTLNSLSSHSDFTTFSHLPRAERGKNFRLPPRASRRAPRLNMTRGSKTRVFISHYLREPPGAELPFKYDDVPRDVRLPTAAAAAGAAAAAEKSLAAPSLSGIIAHSFARTHDTYTKTKPKSISRLGSLTDSPPQPPI